MMQESPVPGQATSTGSAQRTDRRKSPRRRVLKDGKLIFGPGRSVVDCTIDNTVGRRRPRAPQRLPWPAAGVLSGRGLQGYRPQGGSRLADDRGHRTGSCWERWTTPRRAKLCRGNSGAAERRRQLRSGTRLGRCGSAAGVLTPQTRPSRASTTSTHQPGSVSPAPQAQPRRAREGVMVVVPGLAHGDRARNRARCSPARPRPRCARSAARDCGRSSRPASARSPRRPRARAMPHTSHGMPPMREEQHRPGQLLRHPGALDELVEAILGDAPLHHQLGRMRQLQLAMQLPEAVAQDRRAMREIGVAARACAAPSRGCRAGGSCRRGRPCPTSVPR